MWATNFLEEVLEVQLVAHPYLQEVQKGFALPPPQLSASPHDFQYLMVECQRVLVEEEVLA